MASLIRKFDKPLRLRLISFLVLVSAILLVAGTWIVFEEMDQRLDADIESDAVIISRFINHTAMASMDSNVLQHTLMEVYKETSRIKLMLVAEKSNQQIIAATIPEWIGLRAMDLPDAHLAKELSQSLSTDNFTEHVESEHNETTIISPLDQHLSSHSGYSEEQKHFHTGSSNQVESHDENNIDKNTRFFAQLENLNYYSDSIHRPLPTPSDASRGAIMVVFDRIPANAGKPNTFLLQGSTVAALILILAIVIYFRVTSQLLRPIEKLMEAMRAQKDDAGDAGEISIDEDDIGKLAENFNSIISVSQNENARLKENMAEVIRKEFDRWKLTKTEKEIALLLIKGFSMQEIGEIRDVKEKSVRQQATGIYTKARVSNRYELTSYFIEDLLDPGSTLTG